MEVARPLFRVKICGVTTPADVALAAAAGADAIGINFVTGSPRRIDAARGRELATAAPPGLLVVGVFAGMAAADIATIVHAVGLGAVQLHGHISGPDAEAPDLCATLSRSIGAVPVIRAVRSGPDGLAEARRWIAAAATHGAAPVMAIVDAPVARGASGASLGGTGARVDWQALASEPPLDIPWALAGGLDPANVAEAIRSTGAAAVDVASGVESSPGRKAPDKVRAFVAAAREAWAGGPVRPSDRG